MKIFGFEFGRKKNQPAGLYPPSSNAGWLPVIREPFAGAWQRNITERPENLLTHYAVFACVSLIAGDISKLRIKLTERKDDGIWQEVENPAFSPVLRKPNQFQIRIKFIESWVISKLTNGNAYVLKERDKRGVVQRLYVLDPNRTRPLVAPDGAVYYELSADHLVGLNGSKTVVPASEIIHDVMTPLFHPLCGVTPLTACYLPALQGLRIQRTSANLFENGAMPGGIITAPGPINPEDKREIQRFWETEYTGDNAGKVAVLGNGMKFDGAITTKAIDAQLIEQLKLSAENICSAYHVPAFMVGVAAPPAYNNIEALNLGYYTQTLQNPIETIEALLDDGLDLPLKYATEFDLDQLLRMDTVSLIKASADAIGGGGMSPNEARARFLNLGPVPGGASPYLQQQNFSLAALEKRDAKPDPFEGAPKPPAPAPNNTPASTSAREMDSALQKALAIV